MRTKLIAGNWKMNMLKESAEKLVSEVNMQMGAPACDVCVCVPFTLIECVAKAAKESPIKVGAQNLSWADSGAFTGEVSADMLIEAGAEYVIIGHSERRAMFGESDQTVNLRLKQALNKGLKPILCIGETLQQRESGATIEVLAMQLVGALSDIESDDCQKIIIAYEPVWAIGTGKTATAQQAKATICGIREFLSEYYNAKTKKLGDTISILYGGSMNASNAKELLESGEIDGGLIGGASLKSADFAQIIAAFNN